jgi:hypothetical protein
VAHATPDGTVRIANGRESLGFQSQFDELWFKLGATIHARIQIDVYNVFYIMELTKHLNVLLCYLNKINKIFQVPKRKSSGSRATPSYATLTRMP